MKKLLVALITMMLIMTASASAATPKVRTILAQTYLRKDPATRTIAVATLEAGTQVQIVTSYGEYYGVKAYVSGKIKKGYVGKQRTGAGPKGLVMDVVKSTPLKASAKASAKTQVKLKKGTKAVLIKFSGTWAKVKVDDGRWKREGWLPGLYLKARLKQKQEQPNQSQNVTPQKQESVPTVQEPTKTGYVNYWYLNLRKEPSTNAEIVVKLSINDRMDLEKLENYWYKVTASHEGNKYQGYVWCEYVSLKKLTEKEVEEIGQKWTTDNQIGIGYVNHKYLNVREEPTTNSKLLGQLYQDDQIVAYEEKSGWYRITGFRGNEKVYQGWVASEYIRME